MKRLTISLAFAAAIPLFASVSLAGAATPGAIVPPENSAAAQYTEAIPTAGGEKQSGGGDKSGHPSPEKVLGSHNAHKLEKQGKAGREVAEVVADTAPEMSGGGQAARAGSTGEGKPPPADNQGSGKSGGPASSGGTDEGLSQAPGAKAAPQTELPSGSSGLGETVAAATGSSSSGQLGALVPLAIAAALAWALIFYWRQRRQVN